jgi:hyperosmotically inducible periplasmic protein
MRTYSSAWVVALLGSVLSMTPALAQKSAGERLDDTTLAVRTKAKLVENDKVSAGWINVEVYKGRVQLAGFVDSDAQKAAAVGVARAAGATEVLDAMIVMPGQRSLGETVDDSGLSTRLKARLLERQGLSRAIAINTEVRRGQVILSGFVPNERYREQAGKIASDVGGASKVHNFIALKN